MKETKTRKTNRDNRNQNQNGTVRYCIDIGPNNWVLFSGKTISFKLLYQQLFTPSLLVTVLNMGWAVLVHTDH